MKIKDIINGVEAGNYRKVGMSHEMFSQLSDNNMWYTGVAEYMTEHFKVFIINHKLRVIFTQGGLYLGLARSFCHKSTEDDPCFCSRFNLEYCDPVALLQERQKAWGVLCEEWETNKYPVVSNFSYEQEID